MARTSRLLGLSLFALALVGLGRSLSVAGGAEAASAATVPKASVRELGELERRIDALENRVFALSVQRHVEEKGALAGSATPQPPGAEDKPEPVERAHGESQDDAAAERETERAEEDESESDEELAAGANTPDSSHSV